MDDILHASLRAIAAHMIISDHYDLHVDMHDITRFIEALWPTAYGRMGTRKTFSGVYVSSGWLSNVLRGSAKITLTTPQMQPGACGRNRKRFDRARPLRARR
jgi:hypothetical protein